MLSVGTERQGRHGALPDSTSRPHSTADVTRDGPNRERGIAHDRDHFPSPVDPGLACRPGVSDADAGTDRAPRGARTGAPRPAWRGAHRGGGTARAVLRRHCGSGRDCPAIRRHGGARGRPATGAVHRRGHHALGPPRARPHPRGRALAP